jgi:membrane-bound lytic murein transglycosylase MltF
MKVNRGLIQKLLIVSLFIGSLSGCINQSGNINSNGSKEVFMVSAETGGSYFTESYLGNMVENTDVTLFQTLSKRDLGFPRIEYVINSYENTIKRHSNRYGFDWRLILAVMNQESRFQVHAVSHRGAYGLMQIMPGTGRDLTSALEIEGVNNPKDNIAGGVYYLWRLYNLFETEENSLFQGVHSDDRIKLALAAYNAGPTRVRDAQRIAEFLNMNPTQWETIRDILPMLSRRYYTMHQFIWENGRPAGGFFNGSVETVNYVESVVTYYDHYQHIFD